MINLKDGDFIWLAAAPAHFEQENPTVIFDLSEYGIDPLTVIEAYEKAGWTIVQCQIIEKDVG